jgi:hypothetical protein
MNLTYVVMFLGVMVLPLCLRTLAYEPDAKLKDLPPAGMGWVIAANAVGLLVLGLTVFAGLKVYDWK